MAESILHQIFSKDEFSEDELDIILPKYKKVIFQKGDYLLKEGQLSNHYWFLEEGFVRSFLIDYDGNEVSTNFFTKRDIVIDWPSFFMRAKTKEHIQALTDCVCWQLDFDSFQQLFHGIEQFRESGRSRVVKSYFELKRHSTSLITDRAKDRYLHLLRTKPDIINNIPLKQLASYLGVTDTSLSRIRKELAKEK